MGRMVWIALGAAGGIVAYRKGQELLEEARARGVVGSIQAASGSAAQWADDARTWVHKSRAPLSDQGRAVPSTGGLSGAAAARALAQSRRTGAQKAPASADIRHSGSPPASVRDANWEDS
jgi:hypothetical protein